jgi:molecular chaperone GrpE
MNSDFFEQREPPAEASAEQAPGTGSEDQQPQEGQEPVSSLDGGGGAGELDALRDRYLRLAAEYDNFRKRTDRERVDARDRAQAQLVEKLLEPLDDLQRVAHFKAESTTVESLLEGVQLVERKLTRALESAGLESLDAQGQRFDPAFHEALMMSPTENPEEDETVGEVFQNGYRFRGTLLRPARVQVRQHGG